MPPEKKLKVNEYIWYNEEKIFVRNGVLDLSGKGIEDLTYVRGLFELLSVKSLILDKNQIKIIPDEIAKLENLEKFSIRDNLLMFLPLTIGKLNRLKIMDISGNSLVRLPSTFKELKSLQELNLSETNISFIFNEIEELDSLKSLNLRRNKIRVIPEFIGNLKNLEELDLRENKINFLPESISNLVNRDVIIKKDTEYPKYSEFYRKSDLVSFRGYQLPHYEVQFLLDVEKLVDKKFQIDKNYLYFEVYNYSIWYLTINGWSGRMVLERIPESIGNLKRLEELSIMNTNITTIPNSIKKLKYLTKVGLKNNKIESLPDTLEELNHLEEIVVHYNQLKHFPNINPAVKKIWVHSNQIEILPDSIEKLKNLEILSADGNNISELPDAIGNLKKLENLSLQSNNLRILPESIGQLSNLKYLNLNKNKLSKLPNSITTLRNLETLSIKNNPIFIFSESIRHLKTLKHINVILPEPVFKVNEYLSLKLEDRKTNVYVKDQLFNQCKFLLLNIPVNKISTFDEIESIDEAAEKLGWTEEGQIEINNAYTISPEIEFWGHCSNVQVWAESNYNTKLLHRNLAFPLLRRLVDVGDIKAKKIFREEIAKRLESGNATVCNFLFIGGYLDYLPKSFFNELIRDRTFLRKLQFDHFPHLENFINFYLKLEKQNQLFNIEEVYEIYDEVYTYDEEYDDLPPFSFEKFLLSELIKFFDLRDIKLTPEDVQIFFSVIDKFYGYYEIERAFNKSIIVPFVLRCLSEESEIKETFLQEFTTRLNSENQNLPEFTLMQSFLEGCDKKELYSLFKKPETDIFNLIFLILKKINDNYIKLRNRYDYYFWDEEIYKYFIKGILYQPLRHKILEIFEKSNSTDLIFILRGKVLDFLEESELMDLIQDKELNFIKNTTKILGKVENLSSFFDLSEGVFPYRIQTSSYFAEKVIELIKESNENDILSIIGLDLDFRVNERISFKIKESSMYMYLYGTPIEELDEVSLDFIDAIKQSEVSVDIILDLLILIDKLDYLREDLFFTLIDWMDKTDIIRKNYSDLLNIIDKLHEDFQYELWIRIFDAIKGTEVLKENIPDLFNLLDKSQSNFYYKSSLSIINAIIENEILLPNYSLIDSKLKDLLKMLYSSKLGINEIKDAFYRIIDVIKRTKLIKDNFLELLNVFDSFDYETPRNILVNALQGGEKEFKGLITEVLIRKNYLWIDTIILTPEFSDYITIDMVNNPAIDFFGTILETIQFIKQKKIYNIKEYGSILKDFLESMKQKTLLSKKEFKELLKISALKELK